MKIFAEFYKFICVIHFFCVTLQRIWKSRIMATAIKAIPTLYGEEATRFRRMAEEAERRHEIANAIRM